LIRYIIPYNTNKNIAQSYNESFKGLEKDDYVCFCDGDTIFLDSSFGFKIQQILDKNPEVEAATCYTNRVGCPFQVYNPKDWWNDDMVYHNEVTMKCWEEHGTDVEDVTDAQLMSGHFILIKKSLWDSFGGCTVFGMLGVDNEIHRKVRDIGSKMYLLKGIYVYHKYRFGMQNDKKHLL
jgi:GT2 family glycosyltransferase